MSLGRWVSTVGAFLLCGFSDTAFGQAGSVDLTFQPNIGGGDVRAILVLADGKILIGGGFTNVGGVSRNGIARLFSNGAVDTSFDPGSGATDVNFAPSAVSFMAVQADGKVLVGGVFGRFRGAVRPTLARLESNGQLDSGFVAGLSTPGNISAIVVQPNGKILVGGYQTSSAVDGVTRLEPDGRIEDGFRTDIISFVSRKMQRDSMRPQGEHIGTDIFPARTRNERYPQITRITQTNALFLFGSTPDAGVVSGASRVTSCPEGRGERRPAAGAIPCSGFNLANSLCVANSPTSATEKPSLLR